MPDNPTQNAPERDGEDHDETTSEEPFDEGGFDGEGFDPEEAERRITRFVTTAGELPGPPVEELADQVAALMRATLRDLEKIMDGEPHNKVLATDLLLGQRARALQQHDPERWQLYAATTLLSGVVVRGARG